MSYELLGLLPTLSTFLQLYKNETPNLRKVNTTDAHTLLVIAALFTTTTTTDTNFIFITN